VDVQALALTNVRSAIGSHVEDGALRDLPNRLVNVTDILWNLGDILDGAVVRNDTIAYTLSPEAFGSKLTQQVFVDNSEFSREHTTVVHV